MPSRLLGSTPCPSLVTNLLIGRPRMKQSSITLDALDLFKHRYDDIECCYATQLRGQAEPINDKVVHPGEPRTVRLTLRVGP